MKQHVEEIKDPLKRRKLTFLKRKMLQVLQETQSQSKEETNLRFMVDFQFSSCNISSFNFEVESNYVNYFMHLMSCMKKQIDLLFQIIDFKVRRNSLE